MIRPTVPPIKCQGIKTKLVGFVLESIQCDGRGRWVEPFLGPGVVLFNVQPRRALVNDINPHIICFYQEIYDGALTPGMVRAYLTQAGERLLNAGESYYYEVRQRFNQTADPLDFLFLSRAGFNGMMRFNRKGELNVPFFRKPDRFRQAYVTKIMQGKGWQFQCIDWRVCLTELSPTDFVYLDPPYIGRHTDYYNRWSDEDARDLAQTAQALPCGFALSMWKENKYRSNPYLELWQGVTQRSMTHFYHVGPTENLRNAMEEALLIKQGYVAAHQPQEEGVAKIEQLSLTLSGC